MGGGARGVKIAIGGNGALVCSRSVAFFEVFTESDVSVRKEKKKNWREIHLLDPLVSSSRDLVFGGDIIIIVCVHSRLGLIKF